MMYFLHRQHLNSNIKICTFLFSFFMNPFYVAVSSIFKSIDKILEFVLHCTFKIISVFINNVVSLFLMAKIMKNTLFFIDYTFTLL